ncbi:pyridoxal phosphate-dependent aminotransferase [Sulfurivirga sp.]|uniref:pyridoxal phosphate-dependent aminotransferase n=1 Tax=Sulfurivirga sp. TaxID=2614236 RepID=UPI0025E614E7|nr:pyridoxal phosphate-dependent aminotransferase [Sulfurivirga sp.]
MAQVSRRVAAVKPSPTLVITAKAAEMRRAGRDVISLGAGEPDFDTPEHIKAAGIRAIEEGRTRYTPVDGIPELKEAIARKFRRDNGLDYTPAEILVSSGGKQSLYNLFQAFLNPGDEVIIPAPYWVSYPDMVLLAEATPVIVSAGIRQSFKVTAGQIEEAITERTRLLILNSPSNPTGAVYTARELEAIAEVLRRHPQVWLATDDMYEHIILGDTPFANLLNVAPDLKDRTVVFNGVSKAYAMTGWRIGYAAGPEAMIAAMRKVQSQSTSNPCSISQYAAVAALDGPQDCIEVMVAAFRERNDYITEAINALPGMKALPAKGAFYSFIDITGAMAAKGYETDTDFVAALLEEAEVAAVPGTAFGAPGHMRISFATSLEDLREAVSRIERFLNA